MMRYSLLYLHVLVVLWLRSAVGGTPVFRRRSDPVLRTRPAADG